MSEQLYNLRTAYRVLEDRVCRALRTQLGDAERLREQRSQALELLQAAEFVSVFPLRESEYVLRGPTAPHRVST